MALEISKRKLDEVIDPKTGSVMEYRAKKSKAEGGGVLVQAEPNTSIIAADGAPAQIARTSNLQAPNMLLTGHEAAIHCCAFSPDGVAIASCSTDKMIYLWDVYGECENWGVLKGHKNAVLDICWDRDSNILSVSADQNGAMWDVNSCTRIRRFRGHGGVVNSICTTRRGDPLVVTGADDCSAKLWDVRRKDPVTEFLSDYQITAVSFSDDATNVFTGGIDDEIKCWDIRTNKVVYALAEHTDTITGIKLSPDGSFLLSNSMDGKLMCWDVRPYVQDKRLVDVFTSHSHDVQHLLLRCAWSPDGNRVSCGSADRFVYVWDVDTKRLLYKLPGHAGAVTTVDFHPKEPIIASCGLDKQIFLGEIKL